MRRHWRSLFEGGVLEASLDLFWLDSEKNYAHCAVSKEKPEPAGEDMEAIRESDAKAGDVGNRAQGSKLRALRGGQEKARARGRAYGGDQGERPPRQGM